MLELCNTPKAPLSWEQVLQNMQEFLHNIKNQWLEYENNTLFDNHGVVSQSEVLGRFYNPNTTPKRQRESSGLPVQNWTGVALKGVLHQGD